MENQTDDSVLHNLEQPGNASFLTSKFIILLLVVAFLGIGTGFLLSRKGDVTSVNIGGKSGDSSSSGLIGSDDLKTFKDKTEGVLKEGGIEGEGQYYLVRPGGDSQNVYLTSSNIDLSKFLNKKVRVWGQTNTAQKAGWLMDVGRLEVLE